MDYYISDTHFGHANIIGLCARPFDSIEEMDHVLIDNWNARVKPDDDVWHLGDFAFKAGKPCESYLSKLNGRIHLIVGNHDQTTILSEPKALEMLASCDYAVSRIDGANRRIWMCHYPLALPPKRTWALYGHVHNDANPEGFPGWPLVRGMDMALNCCVEVNGYMPVAFEELVANNERLRAEWQC